MLCVAAFVTGAALAGGAELDRISLGDKASEVAHQFKGDRSEVIAGGLGEQARRLLAPESADWRGGTASFELKVDPEKANYVTVKFWGSDATNSILLMNCEGKQLGYRHLGDIDLLDASNGKPGCMGRFYYTTTPLPLEMTKGKSKVTLEIMSTGPIWGYGTNFEQYQKPMAGPTRGIYRVYTHTDGCFTPGADERQGESPKLSVRNAPGVEVIDKVKDRVNKEIDGMLKSGKPLNQHQIWFLGRAYDVKWSRAYHNPEVVKRTAETLDALYVGFKADPKTAQAGPSIYNNEWFGFGPAGYAAWAVREPLKAYLDQPVSGAPSVTRRAAWTEMFVESRDWHREHRRQYTNQSMINDTYGIYMNNRGVGAVDASKAMPEAGVRKYLYESVGLQPWLGSERNGVPTKPLGDHYYQLTSKGLTKELGFVGYYGEVLDWMVGIYNATRPSPGEPGDEKLRAQLAKAAKARSFFRYPEGDEDGFRAMRAETIIGWRDSGHYPGEVMYAQRSTWDASAIEAPAATLDPSMVGAVQQMFADNQFFSAVEESLKGNGLRVTAGLLPIPDDYETLKSQPKSSERLPMTAGAGNVAFSDEEDGVVALRHGDETLYISLYWRARYGINNLARVHLVTPRFDQIGVVRQETQFEPSGMTYKRADWTNFGFGNGGTHIRYPDAHSAHAGEVLPIAKVPAGVSFKPGDENIHAGKGDFYKLQYGKYLIGMNCSESKTFDLAVPGSSAKVPELMSGKTVDGGKSLKVGPRSTVVLYVDPPQ